MFDSNTIFEIKAEAFRRMTGHMAPGKDAAALSYPASYEERSAAWEVWNQSNRECFVATIQAMQNILNLSAHT